MMRLCVTIDVEHDCPPFLTTYRGIEEGLPRLLALFRDEEVRATFFTTGDVARRYPDVVRQLVDEGHELGAHGDTHRRFSTMTLREAADEIGRSSETLRAFAPVTSFRAPNLDLPRRFLDILRREGYQVDSSEGRHKHGLYFWRPRVRQDEGLWRVPASMSPTPMRAPGPVPELLAGAFDSPAVPFYHPWDFVDLTADPAVRWDCRVRSGPPALRHLRRTIQFFKGRGALIQRIRDLPLGSL